MEDEDKFKNMSYENRLLGQIEQVKDVIVKGFATELMAQAIDKTKLAIPVLGGMVPEALKKVYSIMQNGSKEESVQLRAALFILGVFGITDKKKVEVPDEADPKNGATKQLIEELTNEFRKSLQFTERKAKRKHVETDEGVTIQVIDTGSGKGSS